MSIGQKFLTVGGLTIISRLLGVIREAFLSHFLGACAEMDAYLIAFKFPCFFRKFFAEGGFQSIFVPYFTDFAARGKSKAAQYFSSRIFTAVFWWMLFFSIVVFIFAKQFVLLMAPGFSSDPEKLALAIEFTRIIFPSVAFVSLSAIYSSVLIANKRFFAYSLSPILVNIILILSLISCQDIISAGYRISVGVLLAGIFQFIYLYTIVKSKNLTMPNIGKLKTTPRIRNFFRKLIPVLGGAGVAQVNIFMDSLFGSFLPTGCIAYIYFADRFVQLPLALFGISMSTILLPEIAVQIAKGNKDQIKKTANDAILFMFRLTMPSVIILITFSYLFISILYGHGKFLEQAVKNTADVLKIFSLGLPAYVLAKILASVLFAQKDSKTPIIAAICSVISNIVLNAILIVPFQEKGIAISTAVSGFVNAYIMYRKSKGYFKFTKDFLNSILKIISSSIVMWVFIEISVTFFNFENSSVFSEITFLLIFGVLGFLVYFLFLLCLREEGARNVIAFIKKKTER
ncbi:MAG: murein biosynthesis integral membrane protein MurJ [Holosporales bacterium]|jgi:putative peptidoglycan lipid II flippase|nr:murein biosynthesis integral membrane protein MurJ [Holosporales bacterium]